MDTNEISPSEIIVDSSKTLKNLAAPMKEKGKASSESDEDIKVMQWQFKQTKKHTIAVPLPIGKLAGEQHHAIAVTYTKKLKPEVS